MNLCIRCAWGSVTIKSSLRYKYMRINLLGDWKYGNKADTRSLRSKSEIQSEIGKSLRARISLFSQQERDSKRNRQKPASSNLASFATKGSIYKLNRCCPLLFMLSLLQSEVSKDADSILRRLAPYLLFADAVGRCQSADDVGDEGALVTLSAMGHRGHVRRISLYDDTA